MNPFLTIIIPTFNSQNSLEETLNSILKQSFLNYEILIVDNCSTDNTLALIVQYATLHSNIKYISEHDKGIYDAMNKGISLAKGTWLYFMGSDDIFYDEDVLSFVFTNTENIQNRIIYGSVQIKGNAGWANNGRIYDGEFNLSKLISRNICQQAIFYKKSVFAKCGNFKVEYDICADWDMNLRLWANFTFSYCERIIAIFKGGNSSYNRPNNYTEFDKWLSIINSFKLRILSNEFTPFMYSILEVSRQLKKNGRLLKAMELLCVFYIHRFRNFL